MLEKDLLNNFVILFGGRVAEELVFRADHHRGRK